MKEERTMTDEIKAIVFRLGEEIYGVDVKQVQTIERMVPLTRVPRTPAFVKGVMNLRGQVMPVIDLRERFGLPKKEYTEEARIITVKVGEIEVGLIVDAANDIIDLSEDLIESPPEVVGGIKAKYLRGVAKLEDGRLLVMLNLEQVLNKDEIVQLENIGG